MKLLKKYPSWICDDCGTKARNLELDNRHYKKGERAPLKLSISTYHEGKCKVCKQIKNVTEPRDYYFPDIKYFNIVKASVEEARAIRHVDTLTSEEDDSEPDGVALITLFSLLFGIISGILIGIVLAKFKMFGL